MRISGHPWRRELELELEKANVSLLNGPISIDVAPCCYENRILFSDIAPLLVMVALFGLCVSGPVFSPAL